MNEEINIYDGMHQETIYHCKDDYGYELTIRAETPFDAYIKAVESGVMASHDIRVYNEDYSQTTIFEDE